MILKKILLQRKKILIFGKNSFIGSNLYSYLKYKHNVIIKNYNIDELNRLNSYDCIINCSTNKNYIKKKYSKKNDIDLEIINKIKNTNILFIFLSSRKVYKDKANISENSKIECLNSYEKNKFITENKILKIRSKNSVILRISNLIGFKKRNPNRVHFTYVDYFLDKIKKKQIISNKKEFRDFLDISTFSKIIDQIIKKKIYGIYNVSIGKKIYLKDINNWLLFYFKNKKFLKNIDLPKKDNTTSFYLNNSKIKKKIRIKIEITQLKKECFKLSKKLFCR